MNYKPRYYQEKASDIGAEHLLDKRKKYNYLISLPTGSGKSIVISEIAKKLDKPLIVFQPNKEILEQNFKKYALYDPFNARIFSASAREKNIGKITFATIGSVYKKPFLFQDFKYAIIDECDLVNPEEGMYKEFFDNTKLKMIGLTATPYRRYSNSLGTEMRFITRTRTKVFKDLIYYINPKELVKQGYLISPQYTSIKGFDSSHLKVNTTGNAYTDQSIQEYFDKIHFDSKLEKVIQRCIDKRDNFLVFNQFVKESLYLEKRFPDHVKHVSSKTKRTDRDKIIIAFRKNKVKGIANVGVLGVGFDYPELVTLIVARPIKSLRIWYQMVGRILRPLPDGKPKDAHVIDLCDNYRVFGKVENLEIDKDHKGKWAVFNGRKQLTNIYI